MRDKLLKTAIKNARLVIKSKGKIEGNFFLVEGAVGKESGVPAGLAITLREAEGLSYEEIAQTMECPVGTVRSRIFRAREAIDRDIKPLLDGDWER